jgi:hypothetical protein
MQSVGMAWKGEHECWEIKDLKDAVIINFKYLLGIYIEKMGKNMKRLRM